MKRSLALLFAATIAVTSVVLPVSAQDADEVESAESYIERSKEFLPYSCEGLVDLFEDDNAGLAEAMKLLIAVSVINRGIVWEEVVETEEEEAMIGKKLEKAITAECEADVETLMAGAVDRAVVAVFAE